MQVKLKKVKQLLNYMNPVWCSSGNDQFGIFHRAERGLKTIDGSNDGLIAMLIALKNLLCIQARVDFPPEKTSKLIRCFSFDCLIMLAHLAGFGPVKISLSMVDSSAKWFKWEKNKV